MQQRPVSAKQYHWFEIFGKFLGAKSSLLEVIRLDPRMDSAYFPDLKK